MRLELDLGSIGRLVVEGDDPRELIRQTTFWRELPTTCPVCAAPVSPQHRKVTATSGANAGKTFDFYRLVCAGEPRHETTLGQYQDGSGLFYRHNSEWTTQREGQQDDELDAPRQAPAQHQQGARPANRRQPPPQPHQVDGEDAWKAEFPEEEDLPAALGGQPEPEHPPGTIGDAGASDLHTRLGRLRIPSKLHLVLASRTLKRDVGHFGTLTPKERDLVLDLAHQIEHGRIDINQVVAS